MEVQIFGNVGQDAEVKKSKDGKEWATFSIADRTKRGGQEQATWVTCYHPNAKVGQYVKKGTRIFVRGELNTNVYQTKEGENRVGHTVFVNKLEFCGGNQQQQNGNGNQQQQNGQQQAAPSGNAQQAPQDLPPTDDLPF